MSLRSADCTEVEYATELYSQSPRPVGTKTDKGDTVQRKRRRGFALLIQVELDPSSDEDQFTCGKFTRLTTTKCSSAGLLTAP